MDEEGLLTEELLRYVKQGLEMGVYFCRGPILGEHGWAFLFRAFLLGKFY